MFYKKSSKPQDTSCAKPASQLNIKTKTVCMTDETEVGQVDL